MENLKEYKIHLETVDLGLKYFGFRWWHFFLLKKSITKVKELENLILLLIYKQNLEIL